MSQTSSPALRAIKAPVQTGSKLARSACGTRRNVRAAARWEIAGVARPPPVANAPAPTADFKNVRRSMMCPYLIGQANLDNLHGSTLAVTQAQRATQIPRWRKTEKKGSR